MGVSNFRHLFALLGAQALRLFDVKAIMTPHQIMDALIFYLIFAYILVRSWDSGVMVLQVSNIFSENGTDLKYYVFIFLKVSSNMAH